MSRRHPRHSGGRAKPAPAKDARVVQALFANALLHHRDGRVTDAEAGYRAALTADPDHAHANNNLAIILRSRGQYTEAAECYTRALRRTPDDANVQSNIGCLFIDLGRFGEAVTHLRKAITSRPDYAEAHFNLGNALRREGKADAAFSAYQEAIRLKPEFPEALCNLGDLLKERAALTAAVDHFDAACRMRPDFLEALNNLGETLKDQGEIEKAIAAYQRALTVQPSNAVVYSNLLLALNYTPAISAEALFRAHRAWDAQCAAQYFPPSVHYPLDLSPNRRLRVGYISPDFCTHSVSFFAEPLLQAHDRQTVEVFCYPNLKSEDATTRRLQALADHWQPIQTLDDATVAELIGRDRIDILVDLAGHTKDNRLLVFARKPAPIQVTWLGYPNTTGMRAMDYRLSDGIADPDDGSGNGCTEAIVRLPQGFLCYRPLDSASPVAPTPAIHLGHVTFGSFNNTSKITRDVVRTWAAILRRVPTARLLLKSKQLGDGPTAERYRQMFVDHGIATERLDLLGRLEPAQDHLDAYGRLDIALDPFPYNGTTTTCEALWMGVPVITLRGSSHVARVGASLLTHCGLTDLIAETETDYIERATALAADLAALTALRAGMRTRLAASPLTDHHRFAGAVENVYRHLWQDWLRQKK
jgi:protein O-GlcNAc transferase